VVVGALVAVQRDGVARQLDDLEAGAEAWLHQRRCVTETEVTEGVRTWFGPALATGR